MEAVTSLCQPIQMNSHLLLQYVTVIYDLDIISSPGNVLGSTVVVGLGLQKDADKEQDH